MREVDWQKTGRASSYAAFINAPMPMVTIFKTLDIKPLFKLKEEGHKLNMLFTYCIGKAASMIPEFYLLPVEKKLILYDQLGISVIIKNRQGTLSNCDIPFSDQLDTYEQAYLERTRQVYESCQDLELTDHMMIGTSSLIHYDIDGLVNMYCGLNNPMLFWGKQQEGKLKVSFQFHHVQMDGLEACAFLERIQQEVNQCPES